MQQRCRYARIGAGQRLIGGALLAGFATFFGTSAVSASNVPTPPPPSLLPGLPIGLNLTLPILPLPVVVSSVTVSVSLPPVPVSAALPVVPVVPVVPVALAHVAPSVVRPAAPPMATPQEVLRNAAPSTEPPIPQNAVLTSFDSGQMAPHPANPQAERPQFAGLVDGMTVTSPLHNRVSFTGTSALLNVAMLGVAAAALATAAAALRRRLV